MKGIILCGGKATRLYPVTISLPKALVGVYDKPLIYYSLTTLIEAGIDDILVIVPPEKTEWFCSSLGDGSQWGIKLTYTEQHVPRGIADAFILGEQFIGGDTVCLILGDNIFYHPNMDKILAEAKKKLDGAVVFGVRVSDPRSFGVIEFDSNDKVISLEEKPANPKSNYIVPGLYFYDNEVIEIAKSLSPSGRGELEITDVNMAYLKRAKLCVQPLPNDFLWHDVGSASRILDASRSISNIQNAGEIFVGCVECAAYKKDYIGLSDLERIAETLNASEYGRYLVSFCEAKNKKWQK